VLVVILDRHPPFDGRIERHMGTVRGHGLNCFRIRFRITEHVVHHEEKLCEELRFFVPKLKDSRLVNLIVGAFALFPSLSFRIFKMESLLSQSDGQKILVHVHDAELLPFARFVQRACENDAFIVYDRHEVFEHAGGLYGFVAAVFEKLYRKKVAGVVAHTHLYESANKSRFPNADVVAVPNFPLTNEYDHDRILDKIEKFDQDSEIVLSYVGSLNYRYDRDIFLVLEVFRSALEHNKRVKTVIAGATGSDSLLSEFSEMREKYGERFEYRGYVSRREVKKIVEGTHISFLLVKPDSKLWAETSANKVYECLLAGSVFINRCALDIDTSPECILDYERESSDEEIVQDVIELLDDTERMRRLMGQAYELGKKYRYEDVEHRYIQLYEELFKGSEE